MGDADRRRLLVSWQNFAVVKMTEEEFEEAVADGIDMVPDELMDAVDNVVILIEEEPRPDLVLPGELDEDGRAKILGLYEGTALTDRDDGWAGALPDAIFIFRGPLMRFCDTRDELIEEIAVTVIHEIAHHFGIEDDRLHELGWG